MVIMNLLVFRTSVASGHNWPKYGLKLFLIVEDCNYLDRQPMVKMASKESSPPPSFLR